MTLITFCDEANDRPTIFDLNKFTKEAEALLNHISLNLLPIEFSMELVKDDEELNLKEVVSSCIKSVGNTAEMIAELKQKYSFFDWEVLQIGYFNWWARWFGNTSHYTRLVNYCGSYHFKENGFLINKCN